MAPALGALFMGGPFRVATFIPHVTVEAVGQDALGITGYPVENGATLSDHSFKLPVRLEMVLGWSDSTTGVDGSIRDIYDRLLRLQATRKPFTISTSRRLYKNMLMESLVDPISDKTFYAMVPRITFRELIISRTQETSSAAGNATTAGVGEGAPAANQPVVDRGTVQTQEVSAQNFAGAYNPGNFNVATYSPDGSTIGNGSFGLGGVNPPTASAIDMGQMSGISPPLSITLPELSVATVEAPGGLQASGPDQYKIFGGGP